MTVRISIKKIALLTLVLAVFSFAQKKYTYTITSQRNGSFKAYTHIRSRGTCYLAMTNNINTGGTATLDYCAVCPKGKTVEQEFWVQFVDAESNKVIISSPNPPSGALITTWPGRGYANSYSTMSAQCEITSIPKCYEEPIRITSANCVSGRGLYMIGTRMEIENYMYSKVRRLWGKQDYATYSLLIPQPQTDTIVHENGECTVFGGGSGLLYEALICPDGFERPKSSSSIEYSSSSVARYSSFEYDENFSSQRPKIDYPPPPNWDFPDPPNWDWTDWQPPNYNMEIDFPKFELDMPDFPPIEIDIPPIDLTSLENALTDLQGLINAGMGLSNQQLQLLNNLLNVTHSQGLLTEQLLTELANGLGLSNSTLEGVNSGIDSLSKLGNSQIEQNQEHFENYINALSKIINQLDEIGDAIKNQDGNGSDTTTAEIPPDPELGLFDSLGSVVQNQGVDFTIDSYLKDSVFILNDNFNIPNGGNNYDLSFNTGVAGIKYTGNFSLTNVFGVNVANYINGFILFAVSIMNLFSYMRAIQTGGRG